jgi:hypothetical protein
MLPILGLISQFVPEIIGLFSKSESAAKVATAATVIIENLTGKTGQEGIDIIAATPELQVEFRKAVMADKHVEEQMRYADRSDARSMYAHYHEMQDKVAMSIMTYNLWHVAGLVLVNALIILFTPEEYMAAVAGVSNIIGMVINSLLKERQDVVGFSFGSSTGSKLKDK